MKDVLEILRRQVLMGGKEELLLHNCESGSCYEIEGKFYPEKCDRLGEV